MKNGGETIVTFIILVSLYSREVVLLHTTEKCMQLS